MKTAEVQRIFDAATEKKKSASFKLVIIIMSGGSYYGFGHAAGILAAAFLSKARNYERDALEMGFVGDVGWAAVPSSSWAKTIDGLVGAGYAAALMNVPDEPVPVVPVVPEAAEDEDAEKVGDALAAL